MNRPAALRIDDLPTSMPTNNRPLNKGASLADDASRLDGVAKVTGAAKYGRDQFLPSGLFVGFIRCPYGAATLESLDEAAAKASPGVVEVIVNDNKEGQFHGHQVGYIVADSPAALWRALAALKPSWKRSSVKTRITDTALDPLQLSDKTSEILAGAEHVLEAEYSTQVQTHSSLETHGGSINHTGETAVCYISSQGTFAATDKLDEALGLPQSKFEVVCEYVGGGFGSKLGGPGKEAATAARVAAKHKRPVYCFASREEEHLDTGNRPSGLARVKMGFNKDGTILGGHIRSWGGVGVGGGGGMRFPSNRYNLGQLQRDRSDHTDVRFNAGGPRAFRAPGCPQGAFAEELMLDEIATIAGVDPLDLRIKLDKSDDRREMMRLGAALIGWKDRQKTGSQTGALRRGFGLGTTDWGSGAQPTECEVVINRDGSVEARTGTQDIGTGQRSSMAIVASSALGVPLKIVTVQIGRSTLPPGPGSGGSVTTPSSAPVMHAAALDARRQLLEVVAKSNGGDAGTLDLKDGQILSAGKPLMSFKDACAKLAADKLIGRAGKGERGEGHSQGVQFVDLTVDTETGVVRVSRIIAYQACGKPIARKMAESQIIGGVIQGISYALFEDRILDRNVGSMVNANFDMYKIAGPVDMPHIVPVLWTRGQTGFKSLGEPPTIPTSGAIACAVFNAIGKPIRSLPITPDKVLLALEGGAA